LTVSKERKKSLWRMLCPAILTPFDRWCLVPGVKIFGYHVGCVGRISGGVFGY
jgi:hypothetical protein